MRCESIDQRLVRHLRSLNSDVQDNDADDKHGQVVASPPQREKRNSHHDGEHEGGGLRPTTVCPASCEVGAERARRTDETEEPNSEVVVVIRGTAQEKRHRGPKDAEGGKGQSAVQAAPAQQ